MAYAFAGKEIIFPSAAELLLEREALGQVMIEC